MSTLPLRAVNLPTRGVWDQAWARSLTMCSSASRTHLNIAHNFSSATESTKYFKVGKPNTRTFWFIPTPGAGGCRSQRSAPRKTEPLNLEEKCLDEGWKGSSSQMPPISAQSSKCNMTCFFIVCLATIATTGVMTTQGLRTHTHTHILRKNAFVTGWLVAQAGTSLEVSRAEQSIYQPTSAQFASCISCGHWQSFSDAKTCTSTTESLCTSGATNAEPLICLLCTSGATNARH